MKNGQLKETIINSLNNSETGSKVFAYAKKITGKEPFYDMNFPALLSLEAASVCNLSCVHCPPQQREFAAQVRKHSLMDYALFERLMDEIDKFGRRRIALHKDGEPLIHPEIIKFVRRVKKNNEHIVYITTNAHKLTPEISAELINKRIDVLNLSIGAATEEFYSSVRGRNFNKVIENILAFLEMTDKAGWRPRIIAQIINLPEKENMQNEINLFREFWESRGVEAQVWDKLNWGVYANDTEWEFRYPCFSLWESFNVNSNGVVTACCMDFRQELVIGNVFENSIEEIWRGEKLKNLRKKHIEGKEDELPLCGTCNYWKWQPRLVKYPY